MFQLLVPIQVRHWRLRHFISFVQKHNSAANLNEKALTCMEIWNFKVPILSMSSKIEEYICSWLGGVIWFACGKFAPQTALIPSYYMCNLQISCTSIYPYPILGTDMAGTTPTRLMFTLKVLYKLIFLWKYFYTGTALWGTS